MPVHPTFCLTLIALPSPQRPHLFLGLASIEPSARRRDVDPGLWLVDSVTAARRIAGMPLVSVIIPHYNDLDALKRCYGRLLQSNWPREDLEIVVADNMSHCGLDAVRNAMPLAIVVLAEIQGAGPARNAGVAASRGDVIAFLDSDCVPEPGWIGAGVAAMQDFDFAGGQVVVFPKDRMRPTPVEAFEMVFNFNFRRYIEQVGFTGTGNMFVPRNVFERVGGFRAGVSEDVDWSFRARAMGYRLGYAPGAVVGHPARSEWTELQRRWIRIIAETYALQHERRLGRLAFLGRALLMPLSIPPHAARVLGSHRIQGARARLGAIQILVRLRLWRTIQMLRVGLGIP